MSFPRRALMLLRNSWGEIEWFLPLLHRIKEEHPSTLIYTVFTCDRFFDEREYFPDLYTLLAQVSERIFRPLDVIGVDTDWDVPKHSEHQLIVDRPPRYRADLAEAVKRVTALRVRLRAAYDRRELSERDYLTKLQELKPMGDQLQGLLDRDLEDRAAELARAYVSAIFDRELAGQRFDLILRDDCFAFHVHTLIHERFPDARVVRGAHGFDLTNRTKEDVFQPYLATAQKVRHILGEGDVWLSCSSNLRDAHHTYFRQSNCPVIGFPRLDQAWVQKVLAVSAQLPAARRLPGSGARLLWISRQMTDSCFERGAWMRITEGVIRVVRERPDVHLIVKSHPRQSIPQLREALSALPDERWTLWQGSTMSAAVHADLVISVWSSAILDCLAVGKPVIEYFEYEKESLNQARDASGTVTGGWRAFGLAVPADCPEEVHDLIDLFQSDPEHEIWRNQRAAFERLHPRAADHTGAAFAEVRKLFAPEWTRAEPREQRA